MITERYIETNNYTFNDYRSKHSSPFARVFWLLGVHCPNLQALSYCSDEFPPTSEALWSLAQGCRDIKYLKLPPVLGSPNASLFNDSCLYQIAQAWPGLLSLTVGGSEISAAGLGKVGKP